MKQAKIEWQQGQPVSQQFEDIYFSCQGGDEEAEYVFLKNNDLPERWLNCQQFVIAETGFGTGLNFLMTVKHWLDTAPADARLTFYSVEKYPLSRDDLQTALSAWPAYQKMAEELLAAYPPAVKGFHRISFDQQRVTLILMLGDVAAMLQQLPVQVDAWYLDGFAPARNPDMWSEQVFQLIADHSHRDTSFSTFTVVGDVRRGLAAAGFDVQRVKGFGTKREMLVGRYQKEGSGPALLPWFKPPVVDVQTKRVAVIGAGIAGVTTAWALASRGWQVSLVEQQLDIAQEGSGNPRGVLLPRITLDDTDDGEFYASAFMRMLNLLSRVKHQRPDFDWQGDGVVQLASSARIQKQIAQLGLAEDYVHRLTAQQASELSGIKVDVEALFYPRAGEFSPHGLCQYLLDEMQHNIRLYTQTRVERLDEYDQGWRLKCDHDRWIDADVVVMANAAQVSNFQQTAFLELQKARGQISVVPANQQSQALQRAVCYEGYCLPAHDGHHVIGATFDTTDLSLSINSQHHEENLSACHHWLGDVFSGYEDGDIEGRVALRATTADRMPVVGAIPDLDYYQLHYYDLNKGKPAAGYPAARYLKGLYVNVGHGARGLTSALLSAEFLAEQINDEPVTVSCNVQQALHPARFLIRHYKKGR